MENEEKKSKIKGATLFQAVAYFVLILVAIVLGIPALTAIIGFLFAFLVCVAIPVVFYFMVDRYFLYKENLRRIELKIKRNEKGKAKDKHKEAVDFITNLSKKDKDNETTLSKVG